MLKMEELVQDLVCALEQSPDQTPLGGLWGDLVLSPLHRRRQIRRRRGRKRYRENSLYPALEQRRCWIEASESSLDEIKGYRDTWRENSTSIAATCSDSDSQTSSRRWRSAVRRPVVRRPPPRRPPPTRQPSWPESDSFPESNAERQLRRRRKVKRMTADITVRLQQKLKVSGADGRRKRRQTSRMQRLTSGSRHGNERNNDGAARIMGKDSWKRKVRKDRRDAADENMSEGETSSSTCSSDPGLFTNDEGRQGDDEQSDWFFEGDCGGGSMLPSWDSDTHLEDPRPPPDFLQPRPSHTGFRCYSRVKRVPGSAACCMRKNRRRIPTKANNVPILVERLRHFTRDPYHRDFWLPSVGKRDRSQLKPLCPLSVCPIESSRLRSSSSGCRFRQTTGSYQTRSDIRRRQEAGALTITSSSALKVFHEDHSNTSTPEDPPGPQGLSPPQGDPEKHRTNTAK